jgi:hypothetical protein
VVIPEDVVETAVALLGLAAVALDLGRRPETATWR